MVIRCFLPNFEPKRKPVPNLASRKFTSKSRMKLWPPLPNSSQRKIRVSTKERDVLYLRRYEGADFFYRLVHSLCALLALGLARAGVGPDCLAVVYPAAHHRHFRP